MAGKKRSESDDSSDNDEIQYSFGKKRRIIIDESNDSSDDDESQYDTVLSQWTSYVFKYGKRYADVEIQTDIAFTNKILCNQCPSDARNEYFAKLVACEMERVPEERRCYIPYIFNIIRILRGDSQLCEAIQNVPDISALDQVKHEPDDGGTQSYVKSPATAKLDYPSSPSLISGRYCDKMKFRRTYDNNTVATEDKEIQTDEIEIIDAMVYRKDQKKIISYDTTFLPKIDLQDISHESNEDVARLVAFELERMPEDTRSIAYPKILNFIIILRGKSASNPSIELCFPPANIPEFENIVFKI